MPNTLNADVDAHCCQCYCLFFSFVKYMNIEFRQNDCKREGKRKCVCVCQCDRDLWEMVKWCYDTVYFSGKKLNINNSNIRHRTTNRCTKKKNENRWFGALYLRVFRWLSAFIHLFNHSFIHPFVRSLVRTFVALLLVECMQFFYLNSSAYE